LVTVGAPAYLMRLQAAEMFAQDADARQVAISPRVSAAGNAGGPATCDIALAI
jgi:hypothetical protein